MKKVDGCKGVFEGSTGRIVVVPGVVGAVGGGHG